MSLLIEGVLMGVFLSVMTGPVFFALVELGIEKGFWAGISLAVGAWFSDMLYILMVYFGLSYFANNSAYQIYIGLLGGIVLIVFGLVSIIKKPKKLAEEQLSAKNYGGFFLKGAAINVLNPFIFIFWGGIISQLSERGAGFSEGLGYLAMILITVGFTDVLKVYSADKIRNYMTAKRFFYMRLVAGCGLIIFGLVLIYKVLI